MLVTPWPSDIVVNLSRKIQAMELSMSQGYKKAEVELTSSETSVFEVLVRISARTPAVMTEILVVICQSLQANDKTES
jgi:hypothetical protein